MVTILSESNVVEEVKETILYQAMTEGFITDDTVAIDATHFEAKDPSKGRKTKNGTQETWAKIKRRKRTMVALSVSCGKSVFRWRPRSSEVTRRLTDRPRKASA